MATPGGRVRAARRSQPRQLWWQPHRATPAAIVRHRHHRLYSVTISSPNPTEGVSEAPTTAPDHHYSRDSEYPLLVIGSRPIARNRLWPLPGRFTLGRPAARRRTPGRGHSIHASESLTRVTQLRSPGAKQRRSADPALPPVPPDASPTCSTYIQALKFLNTGRTVQE